MSYYESVFIARQEISGQQADALATTFTGVIEENGGKVTKTENWGLKSLAYKIKKNRKGHYVLFNLDAPAEAIIEMERQMRFNEDVLRYLTLRLDDLTEEPSIQMVNKTRRSDGEYRGGRSGEFRAREREEEQKANAEKTSSADDTAKSDGPAAKAAEDADGAKTGEDA